MSTNSTGLSDWEGAPLLASEVADRRIAGSGMDCYARTVCSDRVMAHGMAQSDKIDAACVVSP